MLAIEWEISNTRVAADDDAIGPAAEEWFRGSNWEDTEGRPYTEHWAKNTLALVSNMYSRSTDCSDQSKFSKVLKARLDAVYPSEQLVQRAVAAGLFIGTVQGLLKDYYQSRDLSNVTIAGPPGSDLIEAHVEVLSAHSDYCKALFSEHWCRDNDHRAAMSLEDTAYFHAFPVLLEYFYTGDLRVILESTDLIAAVVLACELALSAVVEEILPHVQVAINSENVMSLLTIADMHALTALKGSCVSFCLRRLCDEDVCREQNLCLTPEARAAMRTLRAAFERSTNINGDIYEDVRELIYMLRDAQDEAELSYNESKERNDAELQQCTDRIGWLSHRMLLTATQNSEMQSLLSYKERLMNVDTILAQQRFRLDRSEEFNRSQLAALARMMDPFSPAIDTSCATKEPL